MNSTVFIVPGSIYESLSEKNPYEFKEEDFYHLFGVLLTNIKNETFVITNIFTDRGIQRQYASASTVGVRNRLQIISNGLTATSKALGLIGSTIGNWHTHPNNMETPSTTDISCYRKSAAESGLGFYIGAIASRQSIVKTLRWFLYVLNNDSLTEIKTSTSNGVQGLTLEYLSDDMVYKLDKQIEHLMKVNVEDYLANIQDNIVESNSIFSFFKRDRNGLKRNKNASSFEQDSMNNYTKF